MSPSSCPLAVGGSRCRPCALPQPRKTPEAESNLPTPYSQCPKRPLPDGLVYQPARSSPCISAPYISRRLPVLWTEDVLCADVSFAPGTPDPERGCRGKTVAEGWRPRPDSAASLPPPLLYVGGGRVAQAWSSPEGVFFTRGAVVVAPRSTARPGPVAPTPSRFAAEGHRQDG